MPPITSLQSHPQTGMSSKKRRKRRKSGSNSHETATTTTSGVSKCTQLPPGGSLEALTKHINKLLPQVDDGASQSTEEPSVSTCLQDVQETRKDSETQTDRPVTPQPANVDEDTPESAISHHGYSSPWPQTSEGLFDPFKDLTDHLDEFIRDKKCFDTDHLSREEELESLRQTIACKVCLTSPARILFLSCSHLICCEACSSRLTRCPACRAVIRSRLQVYMQ